MTQKDTNPYKYSDSNKRYQTYDYYTKHTFGGKCAKIPLDAGFSCPNKDGTCGTGGCIFCFSGSAATSVLPDSAATVSPKPRAIRETLREQYLRAAATAERKWNPVGYIPYLQANTNTYAPAARLREVYEEAAALPRAVMLCIATRADCLPDEAVAEIARISEVIPVTVELGLQSALDRTATLIGRGHDFETFVRGYEKIRTLGERVSVGVHIINGLPGEDREDMIYTASAVSALKPNMVKIHLLNVLRGTPLEEMYNKGQYVPMERDAYVAVVCDQLEILPTETVIGRITGDNAPDVLTAPLWSRRKTEITNMIDKEMYRRGTYQGISCAETRNA